ncbi:MAG: hypothetical protein LLF98_05720 [Clostridium sp.]|uniref:hypothetical protein n=1 Tax=Clostridium sp. TaxID=1506 RepID=UPI0025C574C1|nr:hypothetical protein [Clostridium sp.]MCE5220767.1 hypothetical protein [Clostridium sp.]
MDERKELKQELEEELQLVQYRMKMLYIMEEKLLQMKQLAEQAEQKSLTQEEMEALNSKLNDLAIQVRALDGESRTTEDGKILE